MLDTSRQLVQCIAGHALLAVRAVKEVARASLDETLDQALRFDGTLRWIIGQTDDAREGPHAFAERRERGIGVSDFRSRLKWDTRLIAGPLPHSFARYNMVQYASSIESSVCCRF